MSTNVLPNLELDDVTETSIRCTYKPIDNFVSYRLSWRVHGSDWNSAESTTVVTMKDSVACVVEAMNCLPATTYELKLVAIDESGNESEPSRILTVDTDTPECTPKTGCLCVIS